MNKRRTAWSNGLCVSVCVCVCLCVSVCVCVCFSGLPLHRTFGPKTERPQHSDHLCRHSGFPACLQGKRCFIYTVLKNLVFDWCRNKWCASLLFVHCVFTFDSYRSWKTWFLNPPLERCPPTPATWSNSLSMLTMWVTSFSRDHLWLESGFLLPYVCNSCTFTLDKFVNQNWRVSPGSLSNLVFGTVFVLWGHSGKRPAARGRHHHLQVHL